MGCVRYDKRRNLSGTHRGRQTNKKQRNKTHCHRAERGHIQREEEHSQRCHGELPAASSSSAAAADLKHAHTAERVADGELARGGAQHKAARGRRERLARGRPQRVAAAAREVHGRHDASVMRLKRPEGEPARAHAAQP